jgi:hypothetical protein
MWTAFGLAHDDSPILLLPFLPAIAVFNLSESFATTSDAIILVMAFAAQFLGYFVGTLGVRAIYRKTLGRIGGKRHFWE